VYLKGSVGKWDASVKGFPQISTVFDHDKDSPHNILHSSSIRNRLTRLLPKNFFLFDDTSDAQLKEFSTLLPIVKSVEWGEENLQLSIYLLSCHRINGVKFFYEMISRWLLPGKRLSISSFFATDFSFLGLPSQLFTLCEIVISLENSAGLDLVRQQLPIIESEIRMGLVSVYHASKILEIKGLSADEKTSLIQERIAALLERRPKDFDHDIFAQMQHFLVMCGEEFRSVREYVHMSRIIYVFYLFRKALKNQMEKSPGQRFIHVKASKAILHLPFGLRKVLGVFAALNFLGDNELFEERHLMGALKSQFSELCVIEGSFFSRFFKEEETQLLYLEVEKGDGTDFSLAEVKWIKEKLPDEIKNGIEKLTRPLFMPRNEEEVMRNIITLSHQLKFARDLPQVIINFDEQAGSELVYTVIWLRVLKEGDFAIQDLFEGSDTFLKFYSDRIKRVGLLRKKHPKEATVFRLKFATHSFLRTDHSVDLFKARQAIVCQLQRILGEFRDYNGGMIAKQHEQFVALKKLYPYLDRNEGLLLENFFHSIFPIELRSLFNPFYLKNFFSLLLEAVQKNKDNSSGVCMILQTSDSACCYFLFCSKDSCLKEKAMECAKFLQIPSSKLLTIDLEHLETFYLGGIYLEEDEERRNHFLKGIVSHWENLTFEVVSV
jgi:hypothetical protein